MNSQITRTVYSICYPQTQLVLAELMKNESIHEMYHETWTKKQDSLHLEFLDAWKNWVSPRFDFNQEKLSHFYPTNGSSEAIREQIVYLHSQGKSLVVFDAEYEGYEAIANSVGMKVKKLTRFHNIEQVLSQMHIINPQEDIFFISQPSSIDGCWWKDFYRFMDATANKGIEVYLDVTYVGGSKQESFFDVKKYSNLGGIFFSLSKVFGVYYHRIGGVLLQKPNPLLYGNMWFKNLLSMRYGTELMKAYPIGHLDDFLITSQQKSLNYLQQQYNIRFLPADVFLIANVVYNPSVYDWHKEFQRSEKNPYLRLCISPTLEKIIRS